jgi:hypothetical protein
LVVKLRIAGSRNPGEDVLVGQEAARLGEGHYPAPQRLKLAYAKLPAQRFACDFATVPA